MISRLPTLVAAFFAAGLLSAGCGDPKPGPPPGPDPRVCSAGWHTLYHPRQEPSYWPRATQLAWHDGSLLLAVSYRGEELLSVDPSTGQTALAAEGIWRFWLEDDTVLYVELAALYAVPVSGGPAELIVQTPAFDTPAMVYEWSVDREAVYWLDERYVDGRIEASVWKQPRDGSPAVELGIVPTPANTTVSLTNLQRVGDALLLVASGDLEGPHLYSIPVAGGPARELEEFRGATILGTSPDGRLVWRRATGGFNGTRRSDTYAIGLSRLDGTAVEPFWPDKPPNAYPNGAWIDDRGRWHVSAYEWGNDDALHITVWRVDVDGTGTPVACDPQVDGLFKFGVAGGDALYGVVTYLNGYWELIAATPTAQP